MSETENVVDPQEVEQEARKMGWVEEELWKGDPDKWRPAEEFVERGKNIVPILRDRLEKMERNSRLLPSRTRKN